jgi:hypothetical protein
VQANSSGNVLRSEIVGSIKMRVYLSGMPELRLGLNDKVRASDNHLLVLSVNYMLVLAALLCNNIE